MLIEVKRAHVEAECDREHTYVDLAPEDAREGYPPSLISGSTA